MATDGVTVSLYQDCSLLILKYTCLIQLMLKFNEARDIFLLILQPTTKQCDLINNWSK